MPISFPKIDINRQLSIPLARQLYVQLHQQILHGQILFKERLPASRLLASQLNISRGVVVNCYEMLITDGLVAGLGKGGTMVCYRIKQPKNNSASIPANTVFSHRGERIVQARHYKNSVANPLPLTSSAPDFSLFPMNRWQNLSREAMSISPAWYQRDGGTELLKKQLQLYLAQYRGLQVNNLDQILITSGSQSALSLLTHLLADAGDTALLEQPCWSGAQAAFRLAQLKIHSMPVESYADHLDQLSKKSPKFTAKIAVVTPGIQFPTGAVMNMALREKLLSFTADRQCWVIEDDYAAEFSYEQHPAPSLLSHSNSSHVIHIGTMSKLLLPSLRLGWMVVPIHVAAKVNDAMNNWGLQPAYMLQQQLALFMRSGYLSSHLANTRAEYNQRRKFCSDFLLKHARDLLQPTPSISGMNLYLKINQARVDVPTLQQRLKLAGLGCDVYFQNIAGERSAFLLLGHSQTDEPHLAKALQHLIGILSA